MSAAERMAKIAKVPPVHVTARHAEYDRKEILWLLGYCERLEAVMDTSHIKDVHSSHQTMSECNLCKALDALAEWETSE